MSIHVLVAEDDDTQREIIEDILTEAGYAVTAARSGEEALDTLTQNAFDVLLTDMRMPGIDGLELLRRAKGMGLEIEVIVMTAYASVDTAVSAMKEGALDYLAKPFDKDELLVVVDKAADQLNLRRENKELRQLVDKPRSIENIVGESEAMQSVFEIVERAVKVNSTVLITGESGVGKELIARHIHFAGPRHKKPFIVVNCAAIPENLVESELFGHEKGAFTGADSARQGKFEVADGGTLFLDEIAEMRLESQAKLLRVLQDGLVERVGGANTRRVDVRVVAATNQDLRERVKTGEFREDLYFRLEVLPIHLPPLRERTRDFPRLIAHFREKIAERLGQPVATLDSDVVAALQRYSWPGNVRELENTLEQLFILADGGRITADDLPEKLRNTQSAAGEGAFVLPPGGIVLEDVEDNLIRQALRRSGGQIKEAAELLGVSYKTLQYRMKKHEIDPKAQSE